ncbi:MAG: chromosomal replication initiator DnaA [Sphingomonas sp.]|nr:chromosomal replication initiator DnaA [Sphingomonas sp.]
MSQLPLPLAWPASPTDGDFLISVSNTAAAQHLRRWGAWPVMATLLVGPRKSGRSTLARLFAEQSGGTIIDDAERVAETAIFHAWNVAQADRRPLLIVAQAPPPDWRVGLADLRSRLAATPVARIGPPDDALMAALLERQFLRRHIDARPDVIAWLVTRIERSHIAIERAVDTLDAATLATRKRLSIMLARTAMESAGLFPPHSPESGETRA